MVVARAKAKARAAAGAARRAGVRVGPARLEGLPAAWPAGAATVKARAHAHGRWAHGVTVVEPVAGGGTVRWVSSSLKPST